MKSASYDPLERLAKLREIFFSGNDSFGQQTLSITRQSSDPKYSKFRENLRWTYGDVSFVTLHLVGSDNNFGRTSEMDAEFAERNAADLVWMSEGFDFAKRNGSKAIMESTVGVRGRCAGGYIGFRLSGDLRRSKNGDILHCQFFSRCFCGLSSAMEFHSSYRLVRGDQFPA